MKKRIPGRQRQFSLQWIGAAPAGQARAAMLIPQYNESSKSCIIERLRYFNELAGRFIGKIDVVMIDDGSTDNSLYEITRYATEENAKFFVASVSPNGNKVGALAVVTQAVSHEYVMLSDLDTDIEGLDHLLAELDLMTLDDDVMGCYFRMLPFNGTGPIFMFQQMEYCIARCFYRFHRKDRSVSVMPGAGCCFKRKVLEQVYWSHTGLRNGEDREATMIGLMNGYKVDYASKVIALTRPPLTFKNLCVQRIRWYLGYIETLFLQKGFNTLSFASHSSLKTKFIIDFLLVLFVLCFPVLSIIIGLWNPLFLLFFFGIIYLTSITWCICLLLLSPEEPRNSRMNVPVSVLLFPPIKLAIDFMGWTGAFRKFISNNYKQIRK
ncbi:MAG: glycosyltransferase family 2 protein [Chitinophagaceae bacterium]